MCTICFLAQYNKPDWFIDWLIDWLIDWTLFLNTYHLRTCRGCLSVLSKNTICSISSIPPSSLYRARAMALMLLRTLITFVIYLLTYLLSGKSMYGSACICHALVLALSTKYFALQHNALGIVFSFATKGLDIELLIGSCCVICDFLHQLCVIFLAEDHIDFIMFHVPRN